MKTKACHWQKLIFPLLMSLGLSWNVMSLYLSMFLLSQHYALCKSICPTVCGQNKIITGGSTATEAQTSAAVRITFYTYFTQMEFRAYYTWNISHLMEGEKFP